MSELLQQPKSKWEILAKNLPLLPIILFCLNGSNYSFSKVVVNPETLSSSTLTSLDNNLQPKQLWENIKDNPISIVQIPQQRTQVILPQELLEKMTRANFGQPVEITVNPFSRSVNLDINYKNEQLKDLFALFQKYLQNPANLQELQKLPSGNHSTNNSKITLKIIEGRKELEQTGINPDEINQLSEAFDSSDFRVVNLSTKGGNVFCTATYYKGIIITATHCLFRFDKGDLQIEDPHRVVSDIFTSPVLSITKENYIPIISRDIAFLVLNNAESLEEAEQLIKEMAEAKRKTKIGQAIIIPTTRSVKEEDQRHIPHNLVGTMGANIKAMNFKKPNYDQEFLKKIYADGNNEPEPTVNLTNQNQSYFKHGASGSSAFAIVEGKIAPFGVASAVLPVPGSKVREKVISTIDPFEEKSLLEKQTENNLTQETAIPPFDEETNLVNEKNYSGKKLQEIKNNYLKLKTDSVLRLISMSRLLNGYNYSSPDDIMIKVHLDGIKNLTQMMQLRINDEETMTHFKNKIMEEYEILYDSLLKDKISSPYDITPDEGKIQPTKEEIIKIMESSPLIRHKIEPFYSTFIKYKIKLLGIHKLG